MKHTTFFVWTLLAATLLTSTPATGQQFGPWSAPVNVGPPVNTILPEYQPFITKGGLSLYFSLLEGFGAPQTTPQDIWVAKRSSETEPWGTPQRLGPEINIPGPNRTEGQPFVTIDGHYLYFSSNRPGGFGRGDIYVSKRQNKREDFGPMGWQQPVNLGSGVNSPANDQAAFVYEDEATGVTYLYFASDRSGNQDLYVSTLQPDGTFGSAVPVPELVFGTVNTMSTETQVTISRDGLTMYFISNRPGSAIHPPTEFGPGGQPAEDIWVSTRASTTDPWGVPENLDVVNAMAGGPRVNSDYHDGRPSLSFDGTALYFFSAFRRETPTGPDGNVGSPFFDIWVTTRTKLTGQD